MSARLRVLFLTHRVPYAPNRGDRIRAYHMLRQLTTFSDVYLVSLAHTAEEERRAETLRPFTSSVTTARVRRLPNLARCASALALDTPLTLALLSSRTLPPALERIVRNARPDVVLAYCSGMAAFALLPVFTGTPVVIDMVDVDSAKWRALADVSDGPRRWIYAREARTLARFERQVVSRAAATLVVNDRERAALLSLAPGAPVQVVPNGIDLDGFRPRNLPTDRPFVVFCGVLDYGPNEQGAQWLARRVWPQVRARRPDARLLLVGSDPTARIRKLADDDPTIEVTGRVDDVHPYLWTAALSVAPLHISRGVPNKVLEAVAAGLPCVVTRAVVDGLPRSVVPACVVADSHEAFAAAVLNLLNRPASSRRAIAGLANLEPLAWASQLAPLPHILEGAVRAVAA